MGFHEADVLLKDIRTQAVLADKGYDAQERVIEQLQKQGKTAVILPQGNRKVQREYDKELYKGPHRVENCFAKLKQYSSHCHTLR